MAATSSCSGSSKGVRVVLRQRRSVGDEGEPVLAALADGGVELTNDPTGGSKFGRSVIYHFDSFYAADTTQEELFEREVKDSLPCLIHGINLTIMAYGSTGSGKTYTMQGSDAAPGIIPRSLHELLRLRDEAAAGDPAAVSIQLSYLEIYNDRIYDLLSPGRQELAVRQSSDGAVYVAGLTEVPVASIDDYSRAYVSGLKNRTTGPTALNHFSSRSHALLMLTVKHRVSAERLLTGKLYLIDLAGSEDNRRTGNTGVRLTESGGINSSLFALGKCVSAINAGDKRVPFRDSKLTRLLQDSLGGSTQSLMIVAISPGSSHFAATYQTLQFASKSRQIVNVPTANVTVTEKKHEEEKRILEIAAQARLKRQQRMMKQAPSSTSKPAKSAADPRRRPPAPGHRQQPARAADLEPEKENQLSAPAKKHKDATAPAPEPAADDAVRTPLSVSKVARATATPTARADGPRRSQRKRTLRVASDLLFADADDSTDVSFESSRDHAYCPEQNFSGDDDDDNYVDVDEQWTPKQTRKPAKRPRGLHSAASSSGAERVVSAEIERELLTYLNTHPLKDLQLLHCIGKKRADLILACRPFSALENLSIVGLKKASLVDFVQRNAASLLLHQQKQKDS